MQKDFKKGFTLIELLVVIAIIGILSAIVLAALGNARDSARRTGAEAQISQLRAQAELDADTDGNYANVCTAGESLALLVGASNTLQDGTVYPGTEGANGSSITCNTNTGNTEWAAAADTDADGTDDFCADSTGFAGDVTSSLATATACP